MATRWGICGAGKISGVFTTCLKALPPTEHQVVAVAARDLDRARQFAEEFSISKAYGSYEEMAKDPEVDVVYIGTLHLVHHENTILFLNHGKHVLVEKPAAMNLKQFQEMMSLAAERNLFLMEGVWTRCFPAYHKVVEALKNDAVGVPKLLKAEMCRPFDHIGRFAQKSLGGGALMSLGVYPLHVAIFLFGIPDKISVQGTITDTGVDEAIAVILKYDDGCMAELYASIASTGGNEAIIYGTKGTIKIHSPMWCPTEVTLPCGKVTYELPDVEFPPAEPNRSGFVYEANHVRQCLLQGMTESPILPMSNSECVMKLVDHIKKEIGLKFDADDTV